MILAGTGRRCVSAAPKEGTTPRVAGLGQPDGDAVEVLRELVAIYDAGRREPLPLPIKTSYAWADGPARGRRPGARGAIPVEDPATDTRLKIEAPAHVRAWGRTRAPVRSDAAAAARRRVRRAKTTGWVLTPPAVAADAARREDARPDGAIRPARPAAGRTLDHGAAGQRGYRQDFRVGRFGDPLSRRG